MTEQEIERCLERFAMGKACDVMNFDYAGTLAYLQRLKAENAELRARLDRAVELPCRVGDTVYEKGMYEGDVYEHRISKIIFDAEKISFDCTAIGNSIFLTRAAAEARLKELKEKNND